MVTTDSVSLSGSVVCMVTLTSFKYLFRNYIFLPSNCHPNQVGLIKSGHRLKQTQQFIPLFQRQTQDPSQARKTFTKAFLHVLYKKYLHRIRKTCIQDSMFPTICSGHVPHPKEKFSWKSKIMAEMMCHSRSQMMVSSWELETSRETPPPHTHTVTNPCTHMPTCTFMQTLDCGGNAF